MSWLIVNYAAMNIGVHISFSMKALSSYMPRSGIARSRGSSFIYFSEVHPYCFSIVVVTTYNPTNSAGGFPFLHTLSSTCYV